MLVLLNGLTIHHCHVVSSSHWIISWLIKNIEELAVYVEERSESLYPCGLNLFENGSSVELILYLRGRTLTLFFWGFPCIFCCGALFLTSLAWVKFANLCSFWISLPVVFFDILNENRALQFMKQSLCYLH